VASAQVKEFRPSLVAIRDGSRVAQLRELLKDAAVQPEIVCGDAGACEVAAHRDADAVVTGAQPYACRCTCTSETSNEWLA
jgi:1-deoxy-D-xylulose-5-phosphate reductoisomerase